MAVTITGHLEFEGAKRGERYAEVTCEEPYPHTAKVTIVGNSEQDSDDEIYEQLESFWGEKVAMECEIDENGYIVTSANRMKIAEAEG